MKLSGNKKRGRYAPNGRKADAENKRSYRGIKILIAVLAVILALLVAFYITLRTSLRPPDVNLVPKPTSSGAAAGETGASADLTEPPVRERTKFTFVILGMDNGFGNTDTMMVATFDDTKYTLNVVSIPRDTLVNVSWPVKKANSFYAYGKMDRVTEGLTDLLGYRVDRYVKVNLDAFSKLVDSIGGVDFNVPKDMNYDDDAQDLHIHLRAGPQRLDGAHALQLVRARKNVWDTGDIGRIETQQAFLKAAVAQILEKKNAIKLSTLIDIILNDVDTNLTKGNLGWFAKEFLKMDAVNIDFETIPANYYDSINGDSYCTIDVIKWLWVINTRLNPFDVEIKAEDLSILTRGADGKLYVTDGVWAGKKSWGSGSGASVSADTPAVSPMPSDTPGPSPTSNPNTSNDPPPNPSSGNMLPSPRGEDSSPDANTAEPGGDVLPSPTPSILDLNPSGN